MFQGAKSEYVWSKTDPSMSDTIVFESILKVVLANAEYLPPFQMYSHFWYDAPISRLATYYAKQKVPVYLYSFDHVSENFYDYESECLPDQKTKT